MKLFTKLSTLLLCGVAVAVIGCSDLQEDIQGVDVKVENLEKATSSSIAELQSAIDALKAANAALENQKADKTALDAAKADLQAAFDKKLAEVNAAVSALTAVVDGKASAEDVAALSTKLDDAVKALEATIANIEAALGEKADKDDVDAIAGDVDILKNGYAQTVEALTNIQGVLEGKASQEDVDGIVADLNTLKTGYAQTVEALTNTQGALATLNGNFEDLSAVVETLKEGYAQTVAALTNLNGRMDAIEGRVETLESEVKKLQAAYADLEARLQKTLTDMQAKDEAYETAYADLEARLQKVLSDMQAKDEAFENEFSELNKNLQQALTDLQNITAVNAEDIEALKKAHALTTSDLTNLSFAYYQHLEELADYKASVADQLEALELQDATLLKTIQSEIARVEGYADEAVKALEEKQTKALADLEAKINTAWENERALIYNTIDDIQKRLEGAISEGDAAAVIASKDYTDEAIAMIYKTIVDYKAILDESDRLLSAKDDELYGLIADANKSILDYFSQANGYTDEAVAKIRSEVEDGLATLLKTIQSEAARVEGYADEAAKAAVEAAITEFSADIHKTLMDEIARACGYADEAAKAAVEEAMPLILSTIKSEIDRLTGYVDYEIAALKESIKNLEDSLKDTNDKVDALEGRLTSLVFVPEYYTAGIETIDYAFMPYHVKVGMEGAEKKAGYTSDQVAFEITAPETEWNYDCDPTCKEAKTYFESPVRYVTYFMNPDNANLDGVDFSFISKDIETRASVTAPTVAGDVQLAKVADDNGKVRNAVRVPMTATGYIVDEKDGYYPTEGNRDNELTPVFALNATLADDVDVASDFARLDINTFHLTGLADAEDMHLATSAVEALEDAPVFEVVYNGSIDLRKKVFTHYKVNEYPTFDYHVNVDYCEHKIYENDYMNEELPAYEQNPFGLQWDFALVDYVAGGNKTSDSQYATLEGSVLTPCGTQGGKATGKTDITSIGRNPLVRATVSDRNGNVILVSFFKVQILAQSKYTVAETTEWIVPFGCETAATQTWDQFNDNILTVAGCSKSEFDALYELETTQDGTQQYALVNGDYVPAENIFGEVTEKPDATGTTTTVLNWDLAAKDLQAIYYKDNNTVTIYVRYIPRENATNKYAGIYVPLKVTVAKPEGKVTKKLAAYWFDGETKAMINVLEPTNGENTLDWVTDLDQVWSYGAPKFNPTSANPAYTGTFPSYTEDDKNNTIVYRYYFAPEQSSEVFTYDNAEWVLTVDSDVVVDTFDPTVTYKVSKNSDIQGLELKHALDPLADGSIYKNTKLYLTKKGTSERQIIAELDRVEGVITYKQNKYAEFLLNKYASVARSEAKLFANIGIVAINGKEKESTTVDHEYGEHEFMALSLADAINPYYFLRPINVVGNNNGEFIDAKDNGDEVNMFDLLDFTDWRNESFLKKDGSKFVNAWYYAYYNVSKVEAFVEKATCDMNGSWEPIAVAPKIVLGFDGDATITWTNNQNTAENVYNTGYPAPTQYIYEDFGYNYGKITYKNNGTNVQAFNIKVPVRVTYDWGTIDTEVVIAVKETMGNN